MKINPIFTKTVDTISKYIKLYTLRELDEKINPNDYLMFVDNVNSLHIKTNYPHDLKTNNSLLYNLLDYLVKNLDGGKTSLSDMKSYIEKHDPHLD